MNFDTNKLTSAVRLALTLGAVAAVGVAGSAIAQTAGSATTQNKQAKQLKTIVVTGSRIRRVDIETANPIFTISRQNITQSGAVTLGNLIQSMPSISGQATNPYVNNGGGTGAATVSLRGLGSQRTLMLIDGHRVVNNDINQIPAAMVERVEVLKDGASSVYGSDAIGGVVNFIMRKNFQGAEFSANYGITDYSDGATQGESFMFGQTTDKGSIVAGISYNKFDGISSNNRSFSKKARYLYYGQVYAFGSSRIPNGRLVFGNQDLVRITGTDGTSLSDYRPRVGSDTFNYQAQNLIQTPQERTNVFMMGHYQLTDNVQVYLDVFHNKTTSHSAIAPSLADTLIPSPLVISALSYYNPTGVEFSNASQNRFEVRFTGLGQRKFQFGTTTDQVFTGLRGNVGDTSWQWDANINYGHFSQGQQYRGYANLAQADPSFGPSFKNSSGVVVCGTPGNVISGCTPINIFDINAPAQTALLKKFLSNPFTQQIYTSRQASANANGNLFELPAGTVSLAVGALYRKEYTDSSVSSDIQINQFTGTCPLGSACSSSLQGGFNVKEAYAEILIPILKDMPLAHALNVDIGTRYSKYSIAGSTTNSKIAVEWRPIRDLLLRGTVSQVFRAPSIGDVFAGPQNSAPNFVDPCVGYIPGVNPASENAACGASTGATAIPATGIPSPSSSQTNAIVSGSRYAGINLKPELGKSFDFGFVYDPSWLPGFSTSVDLWRIHLNDTITTINVNTVMNLCLSNPSSPFCGLIHRFPTGNISNLFTPTVNLGRLDTSGVDFGFRYRLPKFQIIGIDPGNFMVNFNSTYISRYDNDPAPGTPGDAVLHNAGRYSKQFGNFARWRALASLTWLRGPWTATWRVRYIGKVNIGSSDPSQKSSADSCYLNVYCAPTSPFNYVTTPYVRHIGAVPYSDFSLSYTIKPINTRLEIGVNNAFNKQPPMFYQNVVINANTDVNTYDVIGRYYWARATVKF